MGVAGLGCCCWSMGFTLFGSLEESSCSLMKRLICSLILALMWKEAEACSVCMGASGLTAEATNNAIFFMLGTLVMVFGGIIAAGVSIVRKSRTAVAAHVEVNCLVK